MKAGIIAALSFVFGVFVAFVVPVCAQNHTTDDASVELNALVGRIQAKIRAGKITATEFAAEAADFTELRAKSAGMKPEVAARILHLDYTFHLDVLKDRRVATELRKELETKYQKYLAGTSLGREFELQERAAQAKASQAELVGKPAPELNFIWSGRPKGVISRFETMRSDAGVLTPTRTTPLKIQLLSGHLPYEARQSAANAPDTRFALSSRGSLHRHVIRAGACAE